MSWRVEVWKKRDRVLPSMLREIVLDTETTGLDARTDEIIEIGCVEIYDRRVTGRHYHQYIRPNGHISAGAEAVHGLSLIHI